MKKNVVGFTGMLLLVASLIGCATHPEQEGAIFLKAPEDISSVWLDGSGRLMLVPAKGVVVDRIVDQSKGKVSFAMDGQYLVLQPDVVAKYSGGRIWLSIEGRLRRLDLPGSSEERYTSVHQ